jgi:uncharacterized protein
MSNPLILLVMGLVVGVYGGIMGLGGGTLMIPMMVLGLGMSQRSANATSLAVMLPPVMLPAIIGYWKNGDIDWRIALYMAIGVCAGSFIGWMISTELSEKTLKLLFGFVILYIGAYTIFNHIGPRHLTRTLLLAALVVAITGGLFILALYLDRHKI